MPSMLLLRVVATFTACAWAFAPSAPLSARRPSALMAESSVQERVASTAAHAAIAAAAVSKAVSTRETAAPDLDAKSYVAIDDSAADEMGRRSDARAARDGGAATGGLPRVYDRQAIEQYWKKERGELQKRWGEFLGYAVPFLTKIVSALVQGGPDELLARAGPLAKEAREDMEALGPTYIKLGQMMSVRPGVLPPETQGYLLPTANARYSISGLAGALLSGSTAHGATSIIDFEDFAFTWS